MISGVVSVALILNGRCFKHDLILNFAFQTAAPGAISCDYPNSLKMVVGRSYEIYCEETTPTGKH